MTGTVGGVLAVFVMPPVSMASDRYRGRWGRRIPFLVWATPCTVGALLLMGWAPEIGGWLYRNVPLLPPAFSEAGVILTTLCVFLLIFHVANMILVNLFNALLRDVVPESVMGRFVSLFRIVAALGSFVFSWGIFPHSLVNRQLVCAGLGAVYLVGYLLMCWRVKEGACPPPPPQQEGWKSYLQQYRDYYREFLGIRLYRNLMLALVLTVFATSAVNPFIVLFARNSLGLDMETIGKIFAWSYFAGALAYWPAGYLCDRVGSIPVWFWGLLAYAGALLGGYFWVHGGTGWLVFSLIVILPVAVMALALTACMLQLFAREKFAQFFSCLIVFGWGGGSIFGNYLAGWLVDLCRDDYRVIFLWAAICSLLAAGRMALTWREWRQHGGPDRYVAPA